MVDLSRFVDTSGGTPSVRLGPLVAVLTGTVAFGWVTGLIDLVLSFGGGLAGTVEDLARWLSSGLIRGVLDVPLGAFDAAARSNAEFLATLGPFAQVAAVVEVLVVTFLLLYGARTLIIGLSGVGG